MAPSPRFRAVIFDVDGTLVDSNDAHAYAWVAAFAERELEVDFDTVRRLIGMGADKLIPAATGLPETDPRLAGVGERRGEIFRSEWLPGLRPTPGAHELVARLRRDGFELAVASSARADELRPLLRVAGADALFDEKTTSDDAARSKPDPDIVAAALRRLAIDPADAIMIGDTPYDVEAARRAGVAIIGLRSGGWSADELAGAVAVHDHPGDLLAHLATSPLYRAPGSA
jgi:HAD superfamily hydrolase (TIGR01509 family)